jgi:hypothetical protein
MISSRAFDGAATSGTLADRPIAGLPVAALDVKTTGLVPGVHNVCELALIVRTASGIRQWQALVTKLFTVVTREALALHQIDLCTHHTEGILGHGDG